MKPIDNSISIDFDIARNTMLTNQHTTKEIFVINARH